MQERKSEQKGHWPQRQGRKKLCYFVSWLTPPNVEATALVPPCCSLIFLKNLSIIGNGPVNGSPFSHRPPFLVGDVSISCDWQAASLLSTFPLNFPASRAHLGVNKHFGAAQESPYLIPSTIPLHPEHSLNIFPSTCGIRPPDDLHSDPAGDTGRGIVIPVSQMEI